jgi:membrane-associated phospholipid phosphatase
MNNQIFFFFYNFAHQSALLDKLIVFFAVYFPYIVVILVGVFLLFHHEVLTAEEPFRVFMEKKREILMVFITGAIAWIVEELLKALIRAPRPFEIFSQVHTLFIKTDYSFPSGHATFFMALAVSIFLMHKKAGYYFMFFALIIGIARIMGGVHYPTDILGGFALGALIAFLLNYFEKDRKIS